MKKLLALILALVMVFALAACGSEDTTTSEPPAEETTTGDDATDGELITVGFAQVGHESDWRTASTNSCKEVFSTENGYDLIFVDCD